jgi:4-hydroxy-tetrahydrodipicolinate synthase
MLKATDIQGCYPALVTPMRCEDGEVLIDMEAFHGRIAHAIDNGVTGIVIAGTTGQSSTLGHDEQIQLVQDGALFARGYAAGRGRPVQVIAAAGSNSTAEAAYMSREILRGGRVDALLHITGYYNNPPQEGLLRHFLCMADLAAEYDTAVVLYNVPSRTGSNVEAATVIELARHPAIIAIKEASGNLDQVQAILDGTDRETFTVVSGEDHLVAEILRRGGTGVISASANIWGRQFQRMCELAAEGRHDAVAELQAALLPCVEAVFCVKNPIPLHHILGFPLRLPLVSLSEIREPRRSQALAIIERALAIQDFPHCPPVPAQG